MCYIHCELGSTNSLAAERCQMMENAFERIYEMKEQEKISINGVPETMLQTMYARAKETKKKNAVIHDEKAVEIVEKLDYDFALADKDAVMGSGVIARTIMLDKMVAGYLKKYQDAIVINIACGLDTRCYRNEGKYKKWYNIDLPDTINVRSIFVEEQGPVIYQFAESAMDEAWAEKIEHTGEPVLVIIEGLTMYLTEEDVVRIFEIIDKKFRKVTVLVEVMNPFIVKHVKEKSIDQSEAKFTWGVKNGKLLADKLSSFTHVADHSLAEGMAVFVPVYRILKKIPIIANISNKIVILRK